VRTRECAKPLDELAIGDGGAGFGLEVTTASVMRVTLSDVPRQAFVDGAGAQDQELVGWWQPVGHRLDETLQMLEATGIVTRQRAPSSVAKGRIVSDMAGRPMMGRDG
jgi:hypothetical protein